MTVGPSHPTVSEASRLQSLEDAVVTLRRILNAQQEKLEEVDAEILRVEDMVQGAKDDLDELEDKVDALSSGN